MTTSANRLITLGLAGWDKYNNLLLKCKCKCGNIIITRENNEAKSCGHCHIKERFPKEYNSYRNMMLRCYNIKDINYKNYGGRGIIVCQSWKEDFFNFLDDMGRRSKGKTLDRKDNNKGYYKDNCRWATSKEQQNNKRNKVTDG